MTHQMWQSPETPQPKKRRALRFLLIIAGIVILAIVGLAFLGQSAKKTGSGNSTAPLAASQKTPSPAPSPPPVTPSPSIQPANRVAFVITGNIPASGFGEVDINYGSDSDTHDVTLPALSGRVKYVVKFDPTAQYYSLDVTFTSAGNVQCKIVALGPSPDIPLTVSHGSASGGSNGGLCTAQAAPNNSNGESWQNEG
jgi:hypothetical protein